MKIFIHIFLVAPCSFVLKVSKKCSFDKKLKTAFFTSITKFTKISATNILRKMFLHISHRILNQHYIFFYP